MRCPTVACVILAVIISNADARPEGSDTHPSIKDIGKQNANIDKHSKEEYARKNEQELNSSKDEEKQKSDESTGKLNYDNDEIKTNSDEWEKKLYISTDTPGLDAFKAKEKQVTIAKVTSNVEQSVDREAALRNFSTLT